VPNRGKNFKLIIFPLSFVFTLLLSWKNFTPATAAAFHLSMKKNMIYIERKIFISAQFFLHTATTTATFISTF
jgi:hypothetical protein